MTAPTGDLAEGVADRLSVLTGAKPGMARGIARALLTSGPLADRLTHPCPTCVREGGPYRCCPHCADDPAAHEDGQRDHHDLPCTTCVRTLLGATP